jgi:hypothetical protein
LYELFLPDSFNTDIVGGSKPLIQLISAGTPNHKAIGIEVTIDNKFLIMLTYSGFLNIWHFPDLRLKQRLFLDYECTDFKLLKFSCKLLICSLKTIRVLSMETLQEESEMSITFDDQIGFSRLSFDEKQVFLIFSWHCVSLSTRKRIQAS